MGESQILLAAAALLIAGVLLPIPSGVRAILTVLLIGFAVLSALGSALGYFANLGIGQ